MRTIVTERSIWLVDEEALRYQRTPRDPEAPAATQVPYTGLWEPYEQLIELEHSVLFHRPVPWGTGARRQTGWIISDTATDV